MIRWPIHRLFPFAATALLAGPLQAQEPEASSYSLEEAIAIALSENPELRTARLGLQSAGQQVREAWGGLLPDVDGSVQYQRNLEVQEIFLPRVIFDPSASPDELVPVRFGADNNWTAQLSVTQPLFDAGALVGVGSAGRFRTIQEEMVRGQAQEIASRVRRTYYDALLARERVRVTQESVRRTEQTLAETEALQRAGLASTYDVLRLEVQLANLRPDLRRAENEVLAAERDLAVAMGFDEVKPVLVVGRLHEVDLESPEANEGANAELLSLVGYREPLSRSFTEIYQDARGMRSDLRQARLDVELQDARVSFERTQFFPRLSAFFNYGITAQEQGRLNFFGESTEQRTTSAAVGVFLEIPIFSGFQRAARLEQQQLSRRQAEVRVETLEREIADEIRTALEALEESRQRAEAARGAVAQARRGFEIVTAEYLAGTSSQLEVTDAEVALRESEFNYAEAVHDYLAAQAALDEAVGVIPVVDPVTGPGGEARLSHDRAGTR